MGGAVSGTVLPCPCPLPSHTRLHSLVCTPPRLLALAPHARRRTPPPNERPAPYRPLGGLPPFLPSPPPQCIAPYACLDNPACNACMTLTYPPDPALCTDCVLNYNLVPWAEGGYSDAGTVRAAAPARRHMHATRSCAPLPPSPAAPTPPAPCADLAAALSPLAAVRILRGLPSDRPRLRHVRPRQPQPLHRVPQLHHPHALRWRVRGRGRVPRARPELRRPLRHRQPQPVQLPRM